MAKVILVNPSMTTTGYSIITPRWLFVMAQATPTDQIGLLTDFILYRQDAGEVGHGA